MMSAACVPPANGKALRIFGARGFKDKGSLRHHGVRWQGGGRDTAFARAGTLVTLKIIVRTRRRGAALPAAVQDELSLSTIKGKFCGYGFDCAGLSKTCRG